MTDNFQHIIIFKNKEIARYDLLAYAIEHRNSLRKSGKYAMIRTIKVN